METVIVILLILIFVQLMVEANTLVMNTPVMPVMKMLVFFVNILKETSHPKNPQSHIMENAHLAFVILGCVIAILIKNLVVICT